MSVNREIDESGDQFPIGMRVLAVDDDLSCLFLLETMLRQCKYNVTTTSEPITALMMLRENKNKFDLVISDVHMPDMDGFKLLELLGLEMDLPVILLSVNDDSKQMMKGITHGACYYLVKPVQIEELKNIWQHVVRRKKMDSMIRNTSVNQDKLQIWGGEGGAGISGNSDQNGKINGKRKDRDEHENEELDETRHDNNDPSTQKKPRVVWSMELHHKFVQAVNQLGIDKAVPKKILDLMNAENLTRENVASHLQKFRLYLKRKDCSTNLPENTVATLNGIDSPNLQMGSLNRLGNFQSLAGSGQFQIKSFPSSGICGRLKTPAGLGRHGLTSLRNIHLGHAQNSSSFTTYQGEFQPLMGPVNHNGSVLREMMPRPLELDQLQNSKGVTCIRGHSTAIDNKSVYPFLSDFTEAKVTIDSPRFLLPGAINYPSMSGHPQEGHSERNTGNQSSVTMPFITSKLSSQLLDFRRRDDDLSTAVLPSRIQSNSFPVHDCLGRDTLLPSTLSETSTSTMALQIKSDPCGLSSITPMSTQLHDSRADLQCHAALASGNRGSNINVTCNTTNSVLPLNGILGSSAQSLNPNNEVEKSAMGSSSLTLNEGYLGPWSNLDYLEDFVSELMEPEQYDASVMEGDL